jgi:hypothetical protein
MSYPLIGALVGLAFAIGEYFMFGVIIDRAAERGESGRGPHILDMSRHFPRRRLDCRLVVRLKQDLIWQA